MVSQSNHWLTFINRRNFMRYSFRNIIFGRSFFDKKRESSVLVKSNQRIPKKWRNFGQVVREKWSSNPHDEILAAQTVACIEKLRVRMGLLCGRRSFERHNYVENKKRGNRGDKRLPEWTVTEGPSDTWPIMMNGRIVERVYLAAGPTDLRKSIDELAVIVQELFQLEPFFNASFVFCNRKKDMLKILF